jgi:drug/metabolite transporter (DMT)-like permease
VKARTVMKLRELAAVVLLAAIWGVSFLLIRIAAPVLGPIVLVNARMLIASGVLLMYAVLNGRQRPALRTSWKAFLLLGALNSLLPLTLEAMAVIHLNASLTAILATTAPLFTALVAALWLHERITLRKGLGLLLGLLGVGVLVGWSPVPLTSTTMLAVGAALLASLLYAVAGIYAKHAFKDTPALPLALGQELAAGLLLVPLALATPPPTMPTPAAIVATVTLALIMTAGGNLLYFYLIGRIGPTKTQTVSFLIPVFALIAGVLFLGEPFTHSMLLGLGVIFLSVVLIAEMPVQPRLIMAAVQTTIMTRVIFLIDALLVQGNRAAWRTRSATSQGATRPFRRWLSAAVVVYDRHSTPVPTLNRRPTMC